MPKKKKSKGGSKINTKQHAKKVKKRVEDLTFGLKNKKKSRKVQAYVSQVAHQSKFAGVNAKEMRMLEMKRNKEAVAKKNKAKHKAELDSLLGGQIITKDGMMSRQAAEKSRKPKSDKPDPSTQLCAFFAQGKCRRGKKCKFSHDESLMRNAAKLDIYTDKRDKPAEAESEALDREGLDKLIAEKEKSNPNQTDIICKYFLEAIENYKYGHRWRCPNGGNACKYRHCLPRGYIFIPKKQRELLAKSETNDEDDITDWIEEQRAKLDIEKCTKVTKELFMEWVEKRREAEAEAEKKRQEELAKAGKKKGKGRDKDRNAVKLGMSGRSLFQLDPSIFQDDDAAGTEKYVQKDPDSEDEKESNGVDIDAPQDETKEQGSGGDKAESVEVFDDSLFLDDDDL